MISQQRLPALNLIMPAGSSRHVSRYRPLVDLETKLEQLAMDSRRTPVVLTSHFADQVSDLLADPRSPNPFSLARLQAPVQSKTLVVLVDYGLGLDDDQMTLPVSVNLAQQHPESSVCGGQPRFRSLVLVHRQLVA